MIISKFDREITIDEKNLRKTEPEIAVSICQKDRQIHYDGSEGSNQGADPSIWELFSFLLEMLEIQVKNKGKQNISTF